jgi:PKHD-type hydroxylase
MNFSSALSNTPVLYVPSFLDNVLTRDDIKELDAIANIIGYSPAEIGANISGAIDKNIRRSNICWLSPDNIPEWLSKKLEKAILFINHEHYQFNLTGAEPFQYTTYLDKDNGEYKWHSDTAKFEDCVRKLSVSILLNDFEEYEGGRLILSPHGNPIVAEEKIGRATFFPSWIPHCVTPVTKGIRRSLVIWAHGPAFK